MKKQQQTEALRRRAADFAENLKPYLPEYGREMLNQFYLYWTEPNRSGSKMRFELQPVFSIPHRLATWSRNARTFGTAGKPAADQPSNRQTAQELTRQIKENLKNQGLI